MKVELKKAGVTLTMTVEAAHSINAMLWSASHDDDIVHGELQDLSDKLDSVIGDPKYDVDSGIYIKSPKK